MRVLVRLGSMTSSSTFQDAEGMMEGSVYTAGIYTVYPAGYRRGVFVRTGSPGRRHQVES